MNAPTRHKRRHATRILAPNINHPAGKRLNIDDHLRNHAFILTEQGWILSPLYDVNPVPYGDELSLNVDEKDNSISIELAISTAVRFGISEIDAKDYAKDILAIVRGNWEKTAAGYGINRRQIEEMRPAFSACYE